MDNEEKKKQQGEVWTNQNQFIAFAMNTHPATVADSIGDLEVKEAAELLLALPSEKRAEIFGHLRQEQQKGLAGQLKRAELAVILEHMNPDERADFFRSLDEDTQESVLPLMARAEREDLRKLGSYEEGTAGSVMTSDYATLTPELTAREAIEKLRQQAPDKETIYHSFVLDPDRKIIGVVSLRNLIVAPPNQKVEEIMDRDVISANVNDSLDKVARMFSKYDLLALPITNGGDALVGIVTVDDVLDVTEAEVTTDFHRIGFSSPLGVSLRDAPYRVLFMKRAPWLLLLVFMNIFSGAGIAYFEDTITAVVSLVFFLPLLIDSGGNAGSQSATLMVRALATGDVRMKDWFSLLKREIVMAISMGLVMGVAVSGIGYFRAGPDVAIVVAMTMVLVVTVGSVIGMCLPFIFTKLKMDPASASAPLITSLADMAGVVIYFGVASWYLKI